MIRHAQRLLPSLFAAGAVIEADRIIDVQALAGPVLVALLICAVVSCAPAWKEGQ